MKSIQLLSVVLTLSVLSGCTSTGRLTGPSGPEITTSARATQDEQSAEVGVQFTNWGDFVAFFSPSRWKSPLAMGGSLSRLNPAAWRADAGRTGRVGLGEAALIGSVLAMGSSTGNGGGTSAFSGSGGGGTPPPPPSPPPPPPE